MAVRAPRREAAMTASIPACPPPTTTTSNSRSITTPAPILRTLLPPRRTRSQEGTTGACPATATDYTVVPPERSALPACLAPALFFQPSLTGGPFGCRVEPLHLLDCWTGAT